MSLPLTLLMSATRTPSLGVYTLWLFALMRLWMVNSNTSRFPFSWNLSKENKHKHPSSSGVLGEAEKVEASSWTHLGGFSTVL